MLLAISWAWSDLENHANSCRHFPMHGFLCFKTCIVFTHWMEWIPNFVLLNMIINLVKLDVCMCQCVHFRRIRVRTSGRAPMPQNANDYHNHLFAPINLILAFRPGRNLESWYSGLAKLLWEWLQDLDMVFYPYLYGISYEMFVIRSMW